MAEPASVDWLAPQVRDFPAPEPSAEGASVASRRCAGRPTRRARRPDRVARRAVVSGTAIALDDPDASPVGERLGYVKGLDGDPCVRRRRGHRLPRGGHARHGWVPRRRRLLLPVGLPHHVAAARRGAPHRHDPARRLLGATREAAPARAVPGAVLRRPVRPGSRRPPGAYPGLRLDSLATLLYVANWHFILRGLELLPGGARAVAAHAHLVARDRGAVLPGLAARGARRSSKLRRSPATVLVVAALGAIASTAWMAWLHRAGGDPTRLYYGTDTHAMTMLSGAALAAALALVAQGNATPRRSAHGALRASWSRSLGLGGRRVLAVMALKVTGTTPWLYKGGFLVAGVARPRRSSSASSTVPRGALGVVLGVGADPLRRAHLLRAVPVALPAVPVARPRAHRSLRRPPARAARRR